MTKTCDTYSLVVHAIRIGSFSFKNAEASLQLVVFGHVHEVVKIRVDPCTASASSSSSYLSKDLRIDTYL
jgi:hypothetical protein